MAGIFKGTIILAFILNVVWIIFPYAFWHHLYNAEEIELISRNGEGAVLQEGSPILYLFLAAYVVTSVGLFYLQSWAKICFVGLMLFSWIAPIFMGISVLGGYDALLSSITGVLNGVILTLSFIVIRKGSAVSDFYPRD